MEASGAGDDGAGLLRDLTDRAVPDGVRVGLDGTLLRPGEGEEPEVPDTAADDGFVVHRRIELPEPPPVAAPADDDEGAWPLTNGHVAWAFRPSAEQPAASAIEAEQLSRQLERAALYTHSALGRLSARLDATEAVLAGLLDALVAGGAVEAPAVRAAAARAADAFAVEGRRPAPGVTLRDPEADEETGAPVDCAARIPHCRAACCHLQFALSADEVEAGHVRWDLGRPYFIRRTAAGACTHLDPTAGGCTVYEHRPETCRRYSCVGDTRIWSDFDAMVANEAWLDEHLLGDRPVLVERASNPVPVELRRLRPPAD